MGVTFHRKHSDAPFPPNETGWNTRDPVTGAIVQTGPTLESLWQSLINVYPSQISKVSIGKTILNRDIWLYRIGNSNGGCVLWDGCMHGWEDLGSEVQYLIANWLLASGDPKAQELLQSNYMLFVPDVNSDSIERGNANFTECANYGNNNGGGVDVCRNFVTGWVRTACQTGSYGLSSGASAGSEAETQAMRSVFQTYKPKVYVNFHYGGGPYLQNCSSNALSTWITDRLKANSLAAGFTFPWTISSGSSGAGMAVGDAITLGGTFVWNGESSGVSGWLWRIASSGGAPYKTGPGTDAYMHNCQTLADIQNWYFPKMLPTFIAMCEACAVAAPTQYTLTISLTGGKGYTTPTQGNVYTYNAGDIVPITHYQNTGWKFDYWQLDGANAGIDNPINVIMNANHVLQAMYLPDIAQFTLTLIAGVGGSTNPVAGAYNYDQGTLAAVTAIPGTDYDFAYWLIDGVQNDTNISTNITMNANHIVQPVFTPKTNTLTVKSIPELNVAVYLDDVLIGNTPITVAITSGAHTISVESEITR